MTVENNRIKKINMSIIFTLSKCFQISLIQKSLIFLVAITCMQKALAEDALENDFDNQEEMFSEDYAHLNDEDLFEFMPEHEDAFDNDFSDGEMNDEQDLDDADKSSKVLEKPSKNSSKDRKKEKSLQPCQYIQNEKNNIEDTYQLLDAMYQDSQHEKKELAQKLEEAEEEYYNEAQKKQALYVAMQSQRKAQDILQAQLKNQEKYCQKMQDKLSKKNKELGEKNTELKKQMRNQKITIKTQENIMKKQKQMIMKLEKNIEKMHAHSEK